MRPILPLALMAFAWSADAAPLTKAEQDAAWNKAMEESAMAIRQKHAPAPAPTSVPQAPKPTPDLPQEEREGNEVGRAFPNIEIRPEDVGAKPKPADVRAQERQDEMKKRTAALLERYRVKGKRPLADLGTGTAGVVPDDMRGLYFLSFRSNRDVPVIDMMETPHAMAVTAETIAIRHQPPFDRYDNNRVAPMSSPAPASVRLIETGCVLAVGRNSIISIERTSEPGLFFVMRHDPGIKEPLRFEFYRLKQ